VVGGRARRGCGRRHGLWSAAGRLRRGGASDCHRPRCGRRRGGDIFDDLGPVVPAALRGHPWTFAATVACGAGLLVWFAGIAASDPYDGALRGIAEAVACFIGFAILGRFLALRS